jgi:hypothetical protein
MKNKLLRVGAIGLCIHLVLNFVALLILHKEAAAFFSEKWWSTWAPPLFVWVTLIAVGFVRTRAIRENV